MKSKKALFNIISQFSYEIVAMVCGLILPKLILSTFGSEYNGMISSITQFLEYISILTLGISGSTRVAIYSAKGDIEKISKILRATEKYMRKVAAFFVLYVIALAFIYPFIINSSYDWINIASLVVIIGIGTFAEYFFGITNNTFLSANQSKYIYNVILIFTKIASTVVSVILIKAGFSIQIVKLGAAICFAAGPIILNYIVVKKYKIIKNVEADKTALEHRKDVMAHSIANTVHQYTDIFLLSIFSSVKIVSVYSVYSLILNSLKKLSNIFTNGLEGAFGDFWARNQKELYEKNFKTFEYLNFVFIVIVFSCTTFLLLPFVKLYTSGVNDVNYIIPFYAYISIISSTFFCLRTPYLIAVQSAGKYKETRNGAILEATFNCLISLILVKPFGLVGVTLGTLFANIFRTMQYELYVSKYLVNRNNSEFFRKMIWSILCFTLIFALQRVTITFEVINWLTWLKKGLYLFTISFLVVLVTSFIFYKNDLINSFKLFKNMLLRKVRK